MRKIFWLTFFVFIFFISSQMSLAQETQDTGMPSAKVEYQLPYPGILPDHPLWFLKAGRDRIMGILIADPLKKADFNLRQADKRLNAALSLLKKEKEKLALSTISKGENYFEMAIDQVKVAKSRRQDTKPIQERLLLSAQKHQEVLQEMKEKVGLGLKTELEKELERVENFEKSVKELSQ